MVKDMLYLEVLQILDSSSVKYSRLSSSNPLLSFYDVF